MLTMKQEKFIQNIVNGMSQIDAYKNSYNASKMKDNVISVKANELLKNGKIRVRYEQLLKEITDKAIMSAKDRQIWLTKVINGEINDTGSYMLDGQSVPIDKKADLNVKLKAMDILNKMNGEYVTKVEGNVSVSKLEDLL